MMKKNLPTRNSFLGVCSYSIAKIVQNRPACGVWIILGGYCEILMNMIYSMYEDINLDSHLDLCKSLLFSVEIILNINQEVYTKFSVPRMISIYVEWFKQLIPRLKIEGNLVLYSPLHLVLLQILTILFTRDTKIIQLYADSEFSESFVISLTICEQIKENVTISLNMLLCLLTCHSFRTIDLLKHQMRSTLTRIIFIHLRNPIIVSNVLKCISSLLTFSIDDQFPFLDDFIGIWGVNHLLNILVAQPEHILPILTIFDNQRIY
jgi:hypothetical protein